MPWKPLATPAAAAAKSEAGVGIACLSPASSSDGMAAACRSRSSSSCGVHVDDVVAWACACVRWVTTMYGVDPPCHHHIIITEPTHLGGDVCRPQNLQHTPEVGSALHGGRRLLPWAVGTAAVPAVGKMAISSSSSNQQPRCCCVGRGPIDRVIDDGRAGSWGRPARACAWVSGGGGCW